MINIDNLSFSLRELSYYKKYLERGRYALLDRIIMRQVKDRNITFLGVTEKEIKELFTNVFDVALSSEIR
ncbi:hypothetical protein [Jeotgalibaca porci]|uniref:hypothetical protein n=1 Tax=Jeotgalibaca porci TaxID=1868793 RepID=UPI00359F4F89